MIIKHCLQLYARCRFITVTFAIKIITYRCVPMDYILLVLIEISEQNLSYNCRLVRSRRSTVDLAPKASASYNFIIACIAGARLEVVGERVNGRARGRHVRGKLPLPSHVSSCARFFLCPLLPSACNAR